MTSSTRRAIAIGLTAATVGALTLAPSASADEPQLTLRDSLYLLPLGPPTATPECTLALLCPVVAPFPAVGSGPDAGVSGLRVTSFPLAPAGTRAEARSEPMPYDGAGPVGTASLAFSADRVAQGSGGTVSTRVRLEEAGGGVVAELPASDLPVDGTRRTVGPVAIDPSVLTPGKSYVAVATFRFDVPTGSVAARIFAPRLLALGPTKTAAKPKPLKPRAPAAKLTGRTLRVVTRCPAGPASCEVQTRAALSGKTLGKGDAKLQAGSQHTFTFRLSAAELRRARRVGRITATLRLEDSKGRAGVARSTLRVPRR